MLRFQRMRNLQKFVAVLSSVHNHFNQERHFYSRQIFKLNHCAALIEWRLLCSAQVPADFGKLRLVQISLTSPSNGFWHGQPGHIWVA